LRSRDPGFTTGNHGRNQQRREEGDC
jgi:hypothetical protein